VSRKPFFLIMDAYPLVLSLPRADTARNTLGIRHTAYVVEVDDCGRIYTRHRRYTNFLWLHRELRRRELACTLPELPPKKAMGSMEQDFVDRRRQLLEGYVRALLRLPAVVLDDALWAFLDADLATAIVPRFLCRPPSHTDAFDCLTQLAKIVAQEANTFRFCSKSVLSNLVAFAQSEAAEAAIQAPLQAQAALQARLGSRVRLCSIIQSLIAHERARQGLVEVGMFGALLALLWRTTEDAEATPTEAHRTACVGVKNCLKLLLEGSQGMALLDFCQQDDGLSALQRLAGAEASSLHQVAASLLWHGFQNSGVVMALAGAKTGLPLLGKLLKSPDLPARVLANLCVGCLVRQDGALDADAKEHCLEALLPLPAELEKAETAALQRTAVATLDRSMAALTRTNSQDLTDTSVVGSDGTVNALAQERDPALVALLQSLCCPKEIPRLQALLGDIDTQGVDAITFTVVALLDHFVRQTIAETARSGDLNPLVPQLQRLVDLHPEGGQVLDMDSSPDVGAHEFSTTFADVRIRAACVLIKLDWPSDGKLGARDAPAFEVFGQRLRILQSVAQHAEALQLRTAGQLAAAAEHRRQQDLQIKIGGLIEAPHVDAARLQEFYSHLASFAERRKCLSQELKQSRQSIDVLGANMDQRGVKRSIITADLDDLRRVVNDQSADETITEEAKAAVARCEEEYRDALANVESQLAQCRASEVTARDAASRARDAEDRAAALSREEAERAEICHSVPAKLEQLRSHLEEFERRKAVLMHETGQVNLETDHEERRHAAVTEADQEAQAALQTLATVHTKLLEFQQTLTSELILTDDEVDRLRKLDVELQPARPSRLRHPLDADTIATCQDENMNIGINADGDGPVWNDIPAELEFRNTPNFRTFSKLRNERATLWSAEHHWLQEAMSRAKTAASRLELRQNNLSQEERLMRDEEEKLRRDLAFWNEPEAHTARHNDARLSAMAARAASCEEAANAVEAAGAQKLSQALLEQVQTKARSIESALSALRETADGKSEQSLRDRRELEKQCVDLEGRARTYLEGWLAIELDERRVSLFREQACEQLRAEEDGRAKLRLEAQRLIDDLQELNRQLDVTARPDRGCDGEWIGDASIAVG